MAGQVLRCQPRMASSLRSRALPTGRCGLQPSARISTNRIALKRRFSRASRLLYFPYIQRRTYPKKVSRRSRTLRISLSRAHLESYRPESWVDVPFYELFLDVQSLFLFTQQYLEDVAFIVRMALPHSQRHQMPAAFRTLVKRLREDVLTQSDPFKIFLDEEANWFEELKDVRDDICHRTAYDRVRAATFPNPMDVMRAGGGVAPFLSANDLRSYVGQLFRRVLALSCVAETFVYSRIRDQHPDLAGVPPAIVVATDEFDPSVSTPTQQFQLGTVIQTFSRSSLQNLEYFLRSA